VRAVDALQKLCHDALCVSAGSSSRYFPEHAVPRQAEMARLLGWSRELARAARQAEHPLNAGLAIEALVTQARRALASGPASGPARRSVSVHSSA
jgi:DNA polymerase-3 subunit delta'